MQIESLTHPFVPFCPGQRCSSSNTTRLIPACGLSPFRPSLQEGMFRCILTIALLQFLSLVSLPWCRGEIPSHLDSTSTFVSEKKCLRNVWDSCSQRLLLSCILRALFCQSTEISWLDTSSDSAGAQNPEKQQWTEVSECPFGHCH